VVVVFLEVFPMTKEFIAYQGVEYTIEWYFDAGGKSLAQEYFDELEKNRQKKVFNLFRLMAEGGKVFNTEKFRYEGDQVYAFKPVPDRFLCFFFSGSKIIVTNAFEKKTDKLPVKEKERALKYRDDYMTRTKKGAYYED
jgi:phage-related protein